MATCGIYKFDKLPARVGLIDVDYLRFRLSENMKKAFPIVKQLEEARNNYIASKRRNKKKAIRWKK